VNGKVYNCDFYLFFISSKIDVLELGIIQVILYNSSEVRAACNDYSHHSPFHKQ